MNWEFDLFGCTEKSISLKIHEQLSIFGEAFNDFKLSEKFGSK